MTEEWRDVPAHPGLQASSLGRIRRTARIGLMPNGGKRVYEAKPTHGVATRSRRAAKHSYRGWYYHGLGNIKIHRAVCEAFNGAAPFPRAVVIHLNEDAHDNRPENLRWGTQKENLNSPGFVDYCRSRRGENNPFVKGRTTKEKKQNDQVDME